MHRSHHPGATDAVVVGTGPNGLAAAVTLARAGLRVELFEARDTIGGGLRTEALFDSDVHHDLCAAVHPLAPVSPFFRAFDLAARGVELLSPPVSYGHPLPDGRVGLAHRDLDATCASLGRDGPHWRRLMRPLLDHSDAVVRLIMHGGRALPRDLATPLLLARGALAHGTPLATHQFAEEPARALLAGVAAHAVGPLPSLPGAAVALLLGHLAHGPGWPVPRGGSAAIAQALAAEITARGGRSHTGCRVDDLRELPPARVVLLDLGPKEFLRIGGARLPPRYARALGRYRYAPAAAKVDFLVSEPIPWPDQELRSAATVHLGGTQREVHRQESATARGDVGGAPFVLVVDPAVADPGRARPGRRPVWAYAHVPNGDGTDPVERVTARIEEFAPGFRDTVLAARGISARAYEAYNPNYVGGDIGAGAMTLRQSLLRPTPRLDPYPTPLPGVYLCSAATPPGPGVHGMSGHLAALSALRREFGLRTVPELGPVPPLG
ncbi:NAD(P)/FAD-dependent oxidoreductase [Streptacidiphilus sp. P02-A3a]|uniref:phytoene desaturase family protein n=1 Tax=Streptacidiphilus sp. P02-A3a TaxID=2704468 RepID=UPI0015FA00AB|nr:NAD(P)/FAD-dependent oxidoreductase [Streptacidiphilus sp. P02-A3a]QMU71488.1 NAD(P)/FAD-dependent oxidoreductase [Streptacidiphilus sp. P02-A3a]